ncbi:MAG: hypothetical protein ACHQ7M_13600 [Chloroflexota bacterium]
MVRLLAAGLAAALVAADGLAATLALAGAGFAEAEAADVGAALRAAGLGAELETGAWLAGAAAPPQAASSSPNVSAIDGSFMTD